MAGASSPYYLLKEEFVQRRDEGCKLPSELFAAFDALDTVEDEWNLERINPIYDALMELPVDSVLQAAEPNELEAIRALRPDGPRTLGWNPSDEELVDKLHGAWTGRCVGCALGKPVEHRGMQRDENHKINGRRTTKAYLQKRGDWPLADYFSNRDLGDGDNLPDFYQSYRENIAYMEPDDDIHYTLVALGVLEEHGAAFTWEDVARYWISHLPISAICTAEMQAMLNVLNVSRKGHHITKNAQWVSTHRNPYREWIGAQIRSDGYAYACAGNPGRAAEFAWRDAHWTHRRNGIYGAMMFAAMQAAAFVISNPFELVQIGLSEIPKNCRLAQRVRQCLGWIDTHSDFEFCMETFEEELNDLHVIHTINNALICIIAMCYGKMDATQTPAIAVMCGLDSDCNGATVGSMVGAIAGRKNFGGILADQLNDTIHPNLLGFQTVTMKELAQRTATVWKTLAD